MTTRKMRSFAVTVVTVLMLASVAGGPACAEEQPITVFAAASTTNAVTDIAALYEAVHPLKIRLSFASSSTLAKQIENGAPVDIFFVGQSQMDELSGGKRDYCH